MRNNKRGKNWSIANENVGCVNAMYLLNAYKLSSDNFIYDNLKNVLLLCVRIENVIMFMYKIYSVFICYVYIDSINSAKSLCVPCTSCTGFSLDIWKIEFRK